MTDVRSIEWWMQSDSGLLARMAIGASFFAALAIHDLAKNGRQAKRWREYSFLLLAVMLAEIYGIANDLLTSRISWEYFYYGKGLSQALGPRVPPNAGRLAWEAAKVGMKASWTAGAIVGVALLIANNPRADRPQLPYRRLISLLPSIVLIVIPFVVAMGIAGYLGRLSWVSDDLAGIVRENQFRPRWFLCVFGIHLGAYVGGLTGITWATWQIARKRRPDKSVKGSSDMPGPSSSYKTAPPNEL
jgi:hypothetical protein